MTGGPREAVRLALELARTRADLGAFWSLADDRALARADALERSAQVFPLRGLPVAIKDNFDLAGVPTTGGLRGAFAPASRDAEAVRRLEAAGAVTIGKTALDPLAWSTHGQADGFPPCRNPRGPRLSPGGSSSGSAVAVAAGIVPVALGSDTAGSVRIPAAYCGIVGVKLSPDPALLDGCLPLAPSFDCAGVLGASVSDCRRACEALLGASVPAPDACAAPVGMLVDLFEDSDPAVARVCHAAVEGLARAGVQIEPVTLGWRAPGFGLLLAVELAAAWHERAAAAPGAFPKDILEAIARAREVDPSKVQSVRQELERTRLGLASSLDRFCALLSPTVPTPVPTVEAENVATSTRFTRIFNALGWPALSVPCGIDSEGGPVGLHLTGTRGLGPLIAIATMIEAALEVQRLSQNSAGGSEPAS